jgi:phage gp36-like protein
MTRYFEIEHLYQWGAPERRLRTIRDRLMVDAARDGDPLTEGEADAAYAAALNAGIDGTCAFADSYIGKVATLPLTSWTDALRKMLAQICALDLLAIVGINATSEANDALLVKRADDARRWLEFVAQGRVAAFWVDSTPGAVAVAIPYASDPPRRWSPWRC